jgi:polyphosphate kinase 2 (PPK2 family)
MKSPRLSDIDLTREMKDKKAYEEALDEVQLRLLRLQQRYYHKGKRAIVLLEGWDAAGKGGAIRRMTEKLDPRGLRVWPIGPPTEEEQGRHYLYRFFKKLPERGTWAIFDRSWYGRVLVERVERYATKEEWRRAYGEINDFEKMLIADGMPIVKLFLHISKGEQLKRFHERESNPYKRWKITKDDWRNRGKWSKYEKAIDEMFEKTSSDRAPWIPIAGNRKWHARVSACEHVAATLEIHG